jgi:hypothetical protein
MDNLFSWLNSLLNFQKVAAITVPGATVALALLLLFMPSEKLSFSGYDFPADSSLGVPRVCNALSREDAMESGDAGRMTLTDYTGIQSRRWQIEHCVRELQLSLIEQQRRAADHRPTIDAQTKAANAFNARFQQAADSGSDLAGEFKAQRDAALRALDSLRADSARIAIRTAYLTALAQRWGTEQTAIGARLKLVDAGEVFTDFAQKLTSKIILFTLVAIAIGFILSPLNQAIINIAYDDQLIDDLNAANRKKGLMKVSTSTQHENEPWLNPNYAVGLKLITQDDVDVVRKRYYFGAELTVGMIAPLILLAIACASYEVRRYPDAGLALTPRAAADSAMSKYAK